MWDIPEIMVRDSEKELETRESLWHNITYDK